MSDFARVHLDVSPSATREAVEVPRDRPFRILVLGGFRGAAAGSTGGGGPGRHRTFRVDRDDLDGVVAKLGPRFRGAPEGAEEGSWEAAFRSLDDFHPDALYRALPPLQPLRRWMEELRNPESARRVAARLASPAEEGGTGGPAPARLHLGPGGLLDEILGVQDPSPPGTEAPGVGGTGTGGTDMESFLRSVVAPHLVPDRPPDQEELLREVGSAVARRLRATLHDPGWQALEALWRGIHLLVSRLDTDALLQLHILDLPRDDLAEALGISSEAGQVEAGRVEDCLLYRELSGEVEGMGAESDGRWGLLVGAWSFGEEGGDVATLRRLAGLGQALGAPVVTGADPALGGGEGGFPAGWEALRGSPEARWLGLVLPRFLLRLPYGADANPCDELDFEEFPPNEAPPHEAYLWGNGALLCALALGERFGLGGWEALPGSGHRVERLPLDIRKVDGTATAKPCAEQVLSEGELATLMDLGFIPLASRKESDVVHLPALRSVAWPPAPLSGPWMRVG